MLHETLVWDLGEEDPNKLKFPGSAKFWWDGSHDQGMFVYNFERHLVAAEKIRNG